MQLMHGVQYSALMECVVACHSDGEGETRARAVQLERGKQEATRRALTQSRFYYKGERVRFTLFGLNWTGALLLGTPTRSSLPPSVYTRFSFIFVAYRSQLWWRECVSGTAPPTRPVWIYIVCLMRKESSYTIEKNPFLLSWGSREYL